MKIRTITILVTGLVLVGGLPATAIDSNPIPKPDRAQSMLVRVPLEHPISLADVDDLEFGSRALAVEGYYFENDEIVGEYSVSSGVEPEAFMAEFSANFGTLPEVHAVVVGVSSSLTDKELKRLLIPISTAIPRFEAQPADYAQHVKERSSAPAPIMTPLAGDWRPEQADVAVYPANGRADFWHSYWWLGNTPGNIPSGFGAEFEVNLHNYALHSGVRHACYVTPVGDYFWAKKAGWNWAVYRPDYATYSVATLGAYADYNDFLDPCQLNSMAIGMRYPQNIQYVNGAYGVMIWLSAPRGNQASSVVSGLVQLVDDSACVASPISPLTNCMGIDQIPPPAGVAASRITLAEWRGWTAPTLCWMSFDMGLTTPFTYSPCPVIP